MLGIMRNEAEKNGDKVETVFTNDLDVRPCTGCMACRSKERCVLPEDDSQRVLRLMQAADAIIMGAPCYWGNIPGKMKLLFDRLVYGLMRDTPRFPEPLMKGKKCILVSTCTTPWPFNIWFAQSRGAIRAMREIARLFMSDPTVGCVSGEKRVAARCEGQMAAEGEGLYWRYESTLKRWDSELYSAMGAAGELYAMDPTLIREVPDTALLDDFMMSMYIVQDGKRIAYTPDAYAQEYGSANIFEESKRKRRIAAGGLQSIWWLRSLLNPLRYPLVSF